VHTRFAVCAPIWYLTLRVRLPLAATRLNFLARESDVPHMEKICVSVNEAAAMLSVCRRTLEHYMNSGVLPSRKLGKKRLIKVVDLQKLVSSNRPCRPGSATNSPLAPKKN
jgi:excisionase family DNA binding protein